MVGYVPDLTSLPPDNYFILRMLSQTQFAWATVGGVGCAVASGLLSRWGLVICEAPAVPSESDAAVTSDPQPSRAKFVWLTALAGFAIGFGFVLAMLAGCQRIPEVRPGSFWEIGRIPFQLSLISLLLAITATDLKTYFIPDILTWPGMIFAVVLATISGELQMSHVWVDWNQEIPQLTGPYLPEWMSQHPHLHGFAWSMAGLTTGFTVTALVRWLTSLMLGMNALGSGDVILMGLIGAFLGWQPAIITLAIAPVLALATIGFLRLSRGTSYIPFGPYLGFAAIITQFNWAKIWMFEWQHGIVDEVESRATTFAIRRFFGDLPSLLTIGAITVVGLTCLLFLRNLFYAIPTERKS